MDDLSVTRDFTTWLDDRAAEIDDAVASGRSVLPGWTRGHVLTHLARNADGLVNLLTWARTGIEHPMYASDSDRDADIEEGAGRISRLLREDLDASNQRFFTAAESLSSTAWEGTVTMRGGQQRAVSDIPFIRLTELAIHIVDLDCGVGFGDVVAKLRGRAERMLEYVVAGYQGREDVPGVALDATLPDGTTGTWRFGSGEAATVSGTAAEALGWLTGRAEGSGLTGAVPALPGWK